MADLWNSLFNIGTYINPYSLINKPISNLITGANTPKEQFKNSPFYSYDEKKQSVESSPLGNISGLLIIGAIGFIAYKVLKK